MSFYLIDKRSRFLGHKQLHLLLTESSVKITKARYISDDF